MHHAHHNSERVPTNGATRATPSLVELHRCCNPSLLRREVIVEVELAGHEHDPLHQLIPSTPWSLQPLSKELSCGKRSSPTQRGGFAETAGSVNSEAAGGFNLRLAGLADEQLMLFRNSDGFYCAPVPQRVTWLRKAARPNVLLPAQPD